MQSGVIAMVTCAVFLRLSSVLKLAVLLLVVAVYCYLIQVAFHVLSVSQPDQGVAHRYTHTSMCITHAPIHTGRYLKHDQTLTTTIPE